MAKEPIYYGDADWWYKVDPTTSKYYAAAKSSAINPKMVAKTAWNDWTSTATPEAKAKLGTEIPAWDMTKAESIGLDEYPGYNTNTVFPKTIAPIATPYTNQYKEGLPQEKNNSLTLADLYKQNMMLYGAQIPLQARSLFQKAPVVPQIPYARTYAPESVSNVAPATSEVNRQQGIANAIGASLGKYGSSGLAMMPGVIANTQSEVDKKMALIGEAENTRINDSLKATALADTANSTAQATAELQRLQLQAASNTASQTEKAAAISNITEILSKMANQRTDYYEANQLEKNGGTIALLNMLKGLTA